jgi:serine/threonine protein kinase
VSHILKQKRIGGRYSLRDPLGRGGMAEVFRAHDETLNRDVALKILREQYADDEGFVERFRREAQSAASLNHPHTVHVYDWGRSEDGTAYYMAMEYVPGGTLKDCILAEGPLPPRTAVQVASQVAQALEAAHTRGVIHRDVKPQNVLLTTSGEAKVTDFGIAQAASATTTSRSGLILGTAGYMPPEQAKGGSVGPQSDLYSLGVVLYEMLTGEVPYEAHIPGIVAAKHLTEPPRSPREANPEVPEEIDALTLRLLAKNPADRYGSATELLADLRRIREGLPPVLTEVEPVATDRPVLPISPVLANPGGDGASGGSYVVYGRHSKKLPWALATAFVAVLVLLGAAAWDPRSGSQEQVRAQDVARGSLDWSGTAFAKGEQATGPKSEASDAGSLSEGLKNSKADTGSPKLDEFVSRVAIPQNGDVGQDPKVGIAADPGAEVDATVDSESEQVSVPELPGGSVEETSPALSDSGHPVLGTAAQRSSEPAGKVIGTDSPVRSMIEREPAVTTMLSTSSASQEGSNGREDNAHATVRRETSAPKQPSKTRKRDQKPSDKSYK